VASIVTDVAPQDADISSYKVVAYGEAFYPFLARELT
jgi:hypothetical protein